MEKRKSIGEVTHYYGDLKVAVVKFSRGVEAGEKVHFKGATTDFEQALDSMQLDHKAIEEVKKGKEVGVKVKDKVRAGDEVYEV